MLTFNLDTTMIEFYKMLEYLFLELNMTSELQKMKQHIYKKRKPLDEFIQMIEKNGFIINEVKHDKFEYKFIDGTAMLHHFFIRLAFLNEWKNIIPSEEQSKIFNNLEYRMNERAGIDGFFKLSVPFVVIDAEKK